jgi:aconitate hydratase
VACLEYVELGDGRVKAPLAAHHVDHNTIPVGFKNPDDHRLLPAA